MEQYLHLSTYDKQDLARRLGVGRSVIRIGTLHILYYTIYHALFFRYHIMDDLMQIQRMAFYF